MNERAAIDKLLKGYPVVIDIPVAWGEMDSFQHVNNIVYFRYFESVRMSYFVEVGLPEMMKETGVGPILASTNCQFKAPLTYPDTVSVGARVSQVQEDRFLMEYLIVSHRLGRVVARGEGLIVTFDYKRQAKTLMPDELWQRILKLEEETNATGRHAP